MARDPELQAHLEWLGYVQPVGIVVSPHALLQAQAHVNRNIVPAQRKFFECVTEVPASTGGSVKAVTDLPRLFEEAFGWEPGDLLDGAAMAEMADAPEAALPEFDEILRPTFAVRAPSNPADGNRWLMLIEQIPVETDLDKMITDSGSGWQASPQARFERLLRESSVPIGLLVNGVQIRLVYAARGESSGHATFPVQAMTEVDGRPIFAALHLLLSAERLFSALPEKQRLPAILADSRKFQNVVSTQLSGQVLEALYEILRGFQAADEQTKGLLLHEALREDPNHVYHGLLTVLLRLVFILYAEDRGLLRSDPVYVNSYSLTGLFERLRSDQGRYPDTMNQRYGAWAHLLTLFRLIHDGGGHGSFRLPARHGRLFNPDIYNFLEGRAWTIGRVMGERVEPPMVSDGVVFRILDKLMVLEGERLSYRSLDVQEIGSVYQAMMGFALEVATGPSIAIKAAKPHGAPTVVNLESLAGVSPDKRARWVREETGQDVSGVADAIKHAKSPEALVTALERKVAREATPGIAPPGTMVLQPSNERRKSGSHYTPRSLTEPIVRTTLKPVLERLGKNPTPKGILDLKVCDPAMGSGAFLVEACRQLADALVASWHAQDQVPTIPPDEDEVLHARRLVAQQCLYGLDKNPVAVDLAKLSLWLATLARDHRFTFLDHALLHGDALVGLTRKQIESFHWSPADQADWLLGPIAERIEEAANLRAQIRSAVDGTPEGSLRTLLKDADEALDDVRLIGNLIVSSFFSSDSARGRDRRRGELETRVRPLLEARESLSEVRLESNSLRERARPLYPFHWEIEFPEVFGRTDPGFDTIVGNPPFAGKNSIASSNAVGFLDWLKNEHPDSHGNADLAAHFYRRAFGLLRLGGTFGLIATNTIAQGDTRSTGLRWICTHGGTIFAARRRLKWPGEAAVVVSVVHVLKGRASPPFELDRNAVPLVTAYLFPKGGHDDPARLAANARRSYIGSCVSGPGFTFDDDRKGIATSLSEMQQLIEKDPRNAERILPYIGGEEINTSPIQKHHRFVMNFDEMSEVEARRWPDLISIVEAKVKPERLAGRLRSTPWWVYERNRPELRAAIEGMERVLAISQTSQTLAFTFLPTGMVYSHKVIVFPFAEYAAFSVLQSRAHDLWARFFGSTMKDDAVYTPSDCFETFPFPENWESDAALETAGRASYEFRAALMIRNDEGLTKTYNRFHDPDERDQEIVKLRELHAAMDAAVLDDYGWSDIKTECEFLLDYEDESGEEDSGRRRSKPWRYRWPDDVRGEVLARLLELNHKRAQDERQLGSKDVKKSRKGPDKAVAVGATVLADAPLFGEPEANDE